MVGIYARLSRDDERAGESVSIENQKEMLSRYVREQGWTLYDYYCDDGVSGTTFDRPGLNRLVQDATDHKINLVLCKDLSRMGRDYIETGKYTDFIFPSLGCRFIALNDGVDTLKKNNEMLVILKNVMNDLYARDTSNKIKAVKQSTFKSGKYVGCYAPPGYRKSEADKHILEINPVTASVVRYHQYFAIFHNNCAYTDIQNTVIASYAHIFVHCYFTSSFITLSASAYSFGEVWGYVSSAGSVSNILISFISLSGSSPRE